MKNRIILLIFICCAATGYSLDSWRDEVLYFVLIDRFAACGEQDRTDVNPENLRAFHGGNINGLINKLDYLQELGVTGIWISPFFKNRPDKFYGQAAYHGYWPWNFWETDERFGSLEDLKNLRKATRQRGMRLVFDMVVNHMGYNAPFSEYNTEWFNPSGEIKDWSCTHELENKSLFGLPDFASHKPVVQTFFRLVARHWNELLEPDGYRLDAVKHVPLDFWKKFNTDILSNFKDDFLLLGEQLDGDPAALRRAWTKGAFNSLFDFPLYYTLRDVIAKGGNCRQLGARLYNDHRYPDASMLATFLDNHDLERFITSCNSNTNRYKMALAFIMAARGIPVLYYGNEQALEGTYGKEPTNRQSMNFDHNPEMFEFTRQLISLRQAHESLRRGLQCHLYMDDTAYAFARLVPDELSMMILNNSDRHRTISMKFPFDLYNDQKIVPAVIGEGRAIVHQGYLSVFLPPESFGVFIPDAPLMFYENEFRHWQRRYNDESAWGYKDVTFVVKADNIPDDAIVFIAGSHPLLGEWNTRKSLLTRKITASKYVAQTRIPLGAIIEYKPFYRSNRENHWSAGDNNISYIASEGSEFLHMHLKD